MRLRQLREEHNKTQKEIADFIGVNRTTYTKYETGDSEPSLNTLKALAGYYGVTLDYLVSMDDAPAPQKEAAPSKSGTEKKQPPKNIEDLPLAPGARVNRKSLLTDEDFITLAAHTDENIEGTLDDETRNELYLIVEDVLRKHNLLNGKDKNKK